MKKIKSIFLKMKAKGTLQTYQKPLLVTIIKLLLINVFLLIIAAIIGLSLDKEGKYFDHNFFKAFVSAVKWMVSVNSINSYDVKEDLKIMVLAVIVIVLGMVIFSGAIIATLTTAIKAYIDKKSKAQGKIEVENHFVILNYNNKVPDIIYNLMCNEFKDNILILSNKSKEHILTEVNSLIATYSPKFKRKANIIVKEGSPLLRGNLEDISINKASNIVIMSREDMTHGDDENISNADLMSLKIMLALGNFNIQPDCNIVVETDTKETADKMENLSHTVKNLQDKTIIPVSFNKKIGQIIAQTIINPMMANIYLDILSYEGSEFYSTNLNLSVDDYLYQYKEAIPIINYDNLFVFSLDQKDTVTKRDHLYKTDRLIKTKIEDKKEDFTVFIIGTNNKHRFIVDNLKLSSNLYGSKFEVKEYHKDDTKTLIADIKKTEGIKKVLILSDDTVSDDSYDANVFVTLIALQSAFPNRENLPFITELLDSRNLSSVKDFNIKNAIISNRIMSLLLTQLAINKNSRKFFDSLLTIDSEVGGDVFDIKVNKVSNIIDIKQDLTFETKAELIQCFYNSFGKEAMLIGMERNGNIRYLTDQLDKKEEIKLEPDDTLIYIKY